VGNIDIISFDNNRGVYPIDDVIHGVPLTHNSGSQLVSLEVFFLLLNTLKLSFSPLQLKE